MQVSATVRQLTQGLVVRVPPEEPNLSATSSRRRLVDGRTASTRQNGQY